MKRTRQSQRVKIVTPISAVAIGVAATIALLLTMPQYAVWGELLVGIGIVVGAYIVADEFILSEFNTLHEIRNGNVAYALLLVAIAILVLAAAIVVG
ncbi:MAG: hypothetical protein KatS3mg038_2156 [Candidatus Kapaibacterium sp.]|nr:MAG: hypothetical protein KatS3mg038_2156 [Candidatus Kapabacteria bacterium]